MTLNETISTSSVELKAGQSININADIDTDGRDIKLNAGSNITTQQLNSSSDEGNAGAIDLDAGGEYHYRIPQFQLRQLRKWRSY